MKNKQKNWLDYFLTYFHLASDVFIDEMHNQLTIQYENYFGKEIDWSKNISLFIEPIPERFVLNYFIDQNNKTIGILTAELKFLRYSIPTKIGWYASDSNENIHPNTYKGDVDIKFEIKEFEIDDSMKDFIINFEEIEKVKKSLDYTFKFPIFCENQKAFFHEGYFIINIEKKYLADIEKVIGQSLVNWNSDEEYPEIKIVPQERGFFHSFRFEGWEDGKAKFYFDNGSAADGIFEYVFSQLDKSDIPIKSIEIIGV